MEVRKEEIEGIPKENLRVPRAAFAELWQEAQRLVAAGDDDQFALGVAVACRWIACGTSTLNGLSLPAISPITRTRRRAHEELLEREYISADARAMKLQGSYDRRRQFVNAAAATLRWAWKGLGDPPLTLSSAQAS